MSTPAQRPAGQTRQASDPDGAPWDAITGRLLEARARIFEDLRNYPPPIAGCDVQFNRLLEQRDAIARELSRWEALRSQWAAGTVDDGTLAAFVDASAFLDEDLKLAGPAGS